MPKKLPLESRYTVVESGCWEWNHPGSNGYGIARVGKSAMPAHRMVYIHYRGPIPAGLELDHLCRNRRCVNPEHLEPVTSLENSRRSTNTKVNRGVCDDIRAEYANGKLLRELSDRFGLSVGHLSEIIRGKYWNEDGSANTTNNGRKRPKPGKRKLSDKDLTEIVRLRMNGTDRKSVAVQFGIEIGTVSRICLRKGIYKARSY